MIITSLILPVSKTKDFTIDREKWEAPAVIYLRRLGFYYVRNKHGVKLKFSALESDKAFYDQAYRDKTMISIGIITAISITSNTIIHQTVNL